MIFNLFSYEQNENFPIGPFRPNDAITNLKSLHSWINTHEVDNFIGTMFPIATSQEGLELFCEAYNLNLIRFRELSFRSFMSLALKMLRRLEKNNPFYNLEKEWSKSKKVLLTENPKALELEFITPHLIKERIDRLFLRAAYMKRRSRQLTRLLNSKIQIKYKYGNKTLTFNNGNRNEDTSKNAYYPWNDADIAVWDRMSILLSHKNSYKII